MSKYINHEADTLADASSYIYLSVASTMDLVIKGCYTGVLRPKPSFVLTLLNKGGVDKTLTKFFILLSPSLFITRPRHLSECNGKLPIE